MTAQCSRPCYHKITMEKQYTRKEVLGYVTEVYVLALYAQLIASRQLLEDVAWEDINSDYRALIHTQAAELAQKLVK